MKFKYCIIDLYRCDTTGTNDQSAAAEFSDSEDYIVVDLTTGQLLVEGVLTDLNQLK